MITKQPFWILSEAYFDLHQQPTRTWHCANFNPWLLIKEFSITHWWYRLDSQTRIKWAVFIQLGKYLNVHYHQCRYWHCANFYLILPNGPWTTTRDTLVGLDTRLNTKLMIKHVAGRSFWIQSENYLTCFGSPEITGTVPTFTTFWITVPEKTSSTHWF